jgi:LPXTG-site transpeptidase (sortase) family protein
VASYQPVDPPHDTAQEWNTAAWIIQSAYPARQTRGTTYVYGHACHHHVCAFTELNEARPGDLVHVATPVSELAYRITRVGTAPKSARSLPAWAADITVADRLVLVTCNYEQGDTSTDNLIAVAALTK